MTKYRAAMKRTIVKFASTSNERVEEFVFSGCSPDEIEPLIKRFHYSKRMPSNIQHCYAVRTRGGMFGDTGQVVAGCVFGFPGTRWSEEVLELARLVRAPSYAGQLSELLGYAAPWLKRAKHNLVVSFADRTQKHHGGIYQASGWNYAGCRDRRMDGVVWNGVFVPGRSANSRWGTRSPSKLSEMGVFVEPHFDDGKHLYWKPLHNSGLSKARRLGLKSKPYPKEFAARRMDEPCPQGLSHAQPVGADPQ